VRIIKGIAGQARNDRVLTISLYTFLELFATASSISFSYHLESQQPEKNSILLFV
jgi:hypothetical protein